MSSIQPTKTKQILFQQTEADDATMRAVAKLVNVSNAEVIRQAMALGLPMLLRQCGLTMGEVEKRRAAMFPTLDVDAAANRGGIRLGNAQLNAVPSPAALSDPFAPPTTSRRKPKAPRTRA